MLHYLTLGHLDTAAVGRREVVLTKQIDMQVVVRLLQKHGTGMVSFSLEGIRLVSRTATSSVRG